MKQVFILTAILLISLAQISQAGNPSRIRALIHGSEQLDSNLDMRVHFIPSGNLIGEVKPLLYLGLGWKATSWLDIEPVLGWSYGTDEPIVSARIFLNKGKFWSWTDIELQTRTNSGYHFTQIDYRFNKYIHAGIETENWGIFGQGNGWSFGGGPDVLLRYGVVGVDIAGHFRNFANKTDHEFVMRFHLFL